MTDKPKKKISPRGAREKGFQFERDLIAFFKEALGLDLARGVAGAQAFNKAKGSVDIFGLPHLAVEAKRTEKFMLNEFMSQAVRNAGGQDIPVVMHRMSRQKMDDSSVVLRLSDFTRLYDAYLRYHGFKPDDQSADL